MSGGLVGLARRVLPARQVNHLSRFAPVLELVASGGGTVLDVGSGSQGIGSLLPASFTVTMLDADFSDYGAAHGVRGRAARWAIVGDARAMPFPDGAFDLVVALDVLEHIPPGDRARTVAEICRVARRRAIIACPAGPEALAADRRIAERLRARGRPVPGWLTEHLENGFPTVEEIVAAAPPGAATVRPSESLAAHERLMLAELSPVPATALRFAAAILERLLTARTPALGRVAAAVLHRLRGRDAAPAYRAVVVVDVPSRPGRQSSE